MCEGVECRSLLRAAVGSARSPACVRPLLRSSFAVDAHSLVSLFFCYCPRPSFSLPPQVFKAGKKDSPEDYNGGRTASDIVTYAKNAASASAKPKPVVQLTSQATLDEQCKEKASLCLVAFVPHILDGGAKARNAVLDTLKSLATKYKSRPFSYVWLEAGSQPELEQVLLEGNTFYPSVVALNLKKERFSPMLGSFGVEPIGTFLSDLLSGKEKTIPLKADKLVVKTTEKWDGKDAAPQATEEKDL